MATLNENRAHRILNVVICAGVLVVISAMATTPRNGPGSFFDVWLVQGLPILLIGLVVLAIFAPRYIRGGRS